VKVVEFDSVAVVDVVLYHVVSGQVVLVTLRSRTDMLILLLESRHSSAKLSKTDDRETLK